MEGTDCNGDGRWTRVALIFIYQLICSIRRLPNRAKQWHNGQCILQYGGQRLQWRRTLDKSSINVNMSEPARCNLDYDQNVVTAACNGSAPSGNYQIELSNGTIVNVYCNNMEGTNCHGDGRWTRVALIMSTCLNNCNMEGTDCNGDGRWTRVALIMSTCLNNCNMEGTDCNGDGHWTRVALIMSTCLNKVQLALQD